MQSKLATKVTGITVFTISLIIYTLSLGPSTSFWDCSEFILSATKLEVNHPAGAPLFMLLGRLFKFLSFGNVHKIAWTINFMSGVFSALTIFFLFHVIEKLVCKFSVNRFTVLGSAAIGALSFAVSDSFWFSAVEGEVYALSMFFLVVTLWAALKWDENYGKEQNEKWILFIALITGLGIGVHLLNLLVLPSVVMLMGLKKYKFSLKNLILMFLGGIAVLVAELYVITPVFMKLLAWFDFLFVNKFSMPLNSGVMFGCTLIIGIFSFLIYFFRKKKKAIAGLATLAVFLFLIGFSVYAVNLIRSSANPPVNFGRPNNIYSLINYLNREQYPKRPLFYGQCYNSPVTNATERHSKDFFEGKYRQVDLSATYDYDENTCSIFPRMYSNEPQHINAYNSWIDIKGKRVRARSQTGKTEMLTVPTLSENIKFFTRYQFGYMFGRYFMWNFVGRQNDRQGHGDILYGNWISGIKFFDNLRLGNQAKIPDWIKNNRGRNAYFFLPLILGLIGVYYSYKKHRNSFWVVLALFIMGSLGLTVYINEVPITPRERDYVFVVAFMAFSIWIGIGFAALSERIKRLSKNNVYHIALFIGVFSVVPSLMFFQNIDDHNRSERTVARDLAINILNSCPKDAILFTSGDNDTYPLLYCQEVEEIRTDVRIVIMPFLSASWFIEGLRKDKYDDSGLKMKIAQRNYELDKLNYVPVIDKLRRRISWDKALNFLQIDKNEAKVQLNSGVKINFLPASNISFNIDSEGKTGEIPVSLKGKNILYKNQLVFWDIISSNAMSRPICFVSSAEAKRQGVGDYLECEGFVYRLVPEKTQSSNAFSIGKFDADTLYQKLKNEYRWGNISNPSVYVDWTSILNVNIFQVRNVFNEVAQALLDNGEMEKAADLLLLCSTQIPLSKVPYDIYSIRQFELMQKAEMEIEANEQLNILQKDINQTLDYFCSLNRKRQTMLRNEIQTNLYYLNQLLEIVSESDDSMKESELRQQLNQFYNSLVKS